MLPWTCLLLYLWSVQDFSPLPTPSQEGIKKILPVDHKIVFFLTRKREKNQHKKSTPPNHSEPSKYNISSTKKIKWAFCALPECIGFIWTEKTWWMHLCWPYSSIHFVGTSRTSLSHLFILVQILSPKPESYSMKQSFVLTNGADFV